MTHPGVGPVVSLTYVLSIGDGSRFRGKQGTGQISGLDLAKTQELRCADLGPSARCGRQRVCAASEERRIEAQRQRSGWHRQYLRLSLNKHHGVAKVAIARKLAVRLYWMLRSGQNYTQVMERGSHAGQPV